MGDEGFVLVLVRGDHVVNECKLRKLAGLADYRLATEAGDRDAPGANLASSVRCQPRADITVIADRRVEAMHDFVVGANETAARRRRELGSRPARSRPRGRRAQRRCGRCVARRQGHAGHRARH
jgi:prolyl-tRNA synthetase